MNGAQFDETINEYIIEWAQQTGIRATFKVEGFVDLSLEIKQALYHIMQEALANVARHSSADNVSGSRRSPWLNYLCGRKKREGWSSCLTGRIGARKPEQVAHQTVTRRVLTHDFVSALVAEFDDLMDRDAPTVRGQIQETERQIAGVEEAIDNPLDVAE
jgi:hypothetical protein